VAHYGLLVLAPLPVEPRINARQPDRPPTARLTLATVKIASLERP